MQQATHIKEQANLVNPRPVAPMNAAGTSFVINLCSSTSPVALAPPDHAGLKRFTFFVSRRREEGRERFRLHMGYFETQEEAEKLLDIVREIYPGAWAGMAPGQRLRAAAAAAQAAPAPIEQEVPPAVAVNAPAAAQQLSAPAPVAAATPTQVATPPAAVAEVPPSIATPAAPVPQPVAAKAAAVTEEISFQLLADDGARRRPQPAADSTPAGSEAQAATRSLNDVRAAIASLEDSTARAPILKPPADLKIPELKPAALSASKKTSDKPTHKPAEKPVVADAAEVLNDEAAMAVLEDQELPTAKPATGKSGAAAAATEKPCYAVQLIWSVQPIDVSQMPQLAIFSAYTLYGAEGNRDGRRWYGLRLGFFTDAVSAKQVAHYVRSEFSTVSVVPVTIRERERAKNASTKSPDNAAPAPAPVSAPAPAPAPAKAAGIAKVGSDGLVSTTQFEFIEDKLPATNPSAVQANGLPGRPALGPRSGGKGGAPGKRAKLRTPAQMAARAAATARPKKLTLEETLEILGAGDLKVDDGRGELLNTESAANAAAPKSVAAKDKPSRLGRLFERLSERIGN
jgi:hypothetical protein